MLYSLLTPSLAASTTITTSLPPTKAPRGQIHLATPSPTPNTSRGTQITHKVDCCVLLCSGHVPENAILAHWDIMYLQALRGKPSLWRACLCSASATGAPLLDVRGCQQSVTGASNNGLLSSLGGLQTGGSEYTGTAVWAIYLHKSQEQRQNLSR